MNPVEVSKLMTLTKAPLNEEDLLSLLLEDAEQAFLNFTNRKEVPEGAESLIRRIAIIYYSRYKNNEGINSMSQGDISISYENSYSTDIPNDIKSELYSYRKLKCCKLFGGK